MFYLLLIMALVSYSLQGNLLIKHARKLDGFQVSMYRGLSLLIIMLPLLAFAPQESYRQILTLSHIGWLFSAGILGYIANATSMQTSKYLPIGILNAINESGKTLLYIGIGILIFKEHLSWLQIIIISILILCATLLATRRSHVHSITPNIPKGLFLLFISMTSGVGTISIMGWLAKSINPFTVGYFWEAFIGIAGVSIILITKSIQKKPFPSISWKQFKHIFWATSPTLIGTGCFTSALAIGPLSIGGAIMTGGVFVSTILAWIMYHEKLGKTQWTLILIIIACIAGLKLIGN